MTCHNASNGVAYLRKGTKMKTKWETQINEVFTFKLKS